MVGAAIWRLPAMVEVVDVSFVGAKNGEKRALSSKKINLGTNGVQNHHGGIKSIGTLVKVR
eukprot:scaffold849_cov42-Cyclotella_meneghiniana.AAC.1